MEHCISLLSNSWQHQPEPSATKLADSTRMVRGNAGFIYAGVG